MDPRFAVLTGTVCSLDTHERSTVTGWGGGGRISQGVGQIRDVTIDTQHETIREIWLRDKEHREQRLTLRTDSVFDPAMREGHLITILSFQGQIWALFNHASKKTAWAITADELAGPLPKVPWKNAIGCLFATVFLVPVVGTLTRNSDWIGAAIAAGSFLIAAVVWVWVKAARKAWRQRLAQWRELTREASMLLVNEEQAN